MRLSTFFFFSLILFATTACGQSYQNDHYDNANTHNMQQETYNAQTANGKVVMHEVRDAQTGMISQHLPLPSSWQVSDGHWTSSYGAEVRFLMPQPGQQPCHSVDEVIQRVVLPTFPQGGFQHLGTLNLPQLAERNRRAGELLWQAAPTEKHYACKGVEYRGPDGKPGLIIINFHLFTNQAGRFPGFSMFVLEVPAKQYEKAKGEVLYALANYEPNPQFIAAHNQREQQKSQMAWNNHNAKMQNRWNAFNNHQANMRDLSQIQDMQHESYMNRSRMQDRGHQKTIDGIRYEESAVNPYDGQQMKVESGYKYYYMNQFGEYFGTNDEFYNPERDPNLNNQEWRRVQYQGGGY